MRMHRGVEVQLHVPLISALDGGEWSDSHTGHFTPGGKKPVVRTGVWVGPAASLDTEQKRKKISLAPARN
jgi:hypothetical protein